MENKELTQELLEKILDKCKKELDGLLAEDATIVLRNLKSYIKSNSVLQSD